MSKRLYIFDLDDTLVERWTENLLPGVSEWFQAVNWETTACAVATNKGNVGLRYAMEAEGWGEPGKYLTEEQTIDQLLRVQRKLTTDKDGNFPMMGSRLPMLAAFAMQYKNGRWAPTPYGEVDGMDLAPQEWSSFWRKPNPGMLVYAMRWARVDAA
jgi:hypothetical protein